MRRVHFLSLAAFVIVCLLAAGTRGGEKKEKVTLKGQLVCGKCTLMATDSCSNVLQVKKGGETVNYFLKDKGKQEGYHKAICPPSTEKLAQVTGTVEVKGDKHYILDPQVKYLEKE